MNTLFATIETLDFQILDAIQATFRSEFLDRVMSVLTHLGDHGILWLIIGILFLFWKEKRKCGAAILVGLLSHLLVINLFLKNVVARPRPFEIQTAVSLLIQAPTDHSFPSGHTGGAFLTAVILLHYDKRIGIPALILAILIAFSRLYLYVHFPSDVLAGAVIGILLGLVAIVIAEKVFLFHVHRDFL